MSCENALSGAIITFFIPSISLEITISAVFIWGAGERIWQVHVYIRSIWQTLWQTFLFIVTHRSALLFPSKTYPHANRSGSENPGREEVVQWLKTFYSILFYFFVIGAHLSAEGRGRNSVFVWRQPVTQLFEESGEVHPTTSEPLHDICLPCILKNGGSSRLVLEAQRECYVKQVK